jgi:uracil-DNA glycosylase family 4
LTEPWPGDPATAGTPVAGSAADVLEMSVGAVSLTDLDARVSVCRACPRLVAWREEVARDKRRAFAGEPYWGRPVPGWGAHRPRILVLGLAPAAHGGNRTGRVFTGDRSGDWLFASMHAAGLANQPTSVHAGDGLELVDTRIVAAVRCAPPQNRPTPLERDTCTPWLDAELAFVRPSLRVVVALGSFAWDAALTALARAGDALPRPRPRFGHGAVVTVGAVTVGAPTVGALTVLGSYHPSQQNTFTGKLTRPMLDAVFARAVEIASGDEPSGNRPAHTKSPTR